MARALEPKKINNLGIYGLIRPAEVDDDLIPDGAVTEAINVHFDRKGAVTVRPGMATLGATASVVSGTAYIGNPCIGLHNAQGSFLLAAFTIGPSSGVVNTWAATVYYFYPPSSWGTLLNLDYPDSSAKIRFIDFGNATLILTGSYTSIRTISGSRFDTGGVSAGAVGPLYPQQLSDARIRAKFGDVYKSKIYLAGNVNKPSRLYFSSVIDTNGDVTWNVSVDFVDINPGDGEELTSVKRYSLELLLFKPNYIYRFRTSGLDPDPLIRVGTRSHESVIEGKQGLYFHHETGFYKYSGGYPVEISRAISDIIAAIPFTQLDDVIGWRDSDHIYWSLGNLTISSETSGNITWKNVVVRYTESSEVWTVYSYSSDIRRAVTYIGNNQMSTVAGNDYGVIATLNSGVTDMGEPIKYRARTKWYDWGAVGEKKVLDELIAVCERAQASEIMYQTDENYEYKTIGTLKKMINLFDKQGIKFNRIRFLFTGVSRFESPLFKSLEIIKGINEGVVSEYLK